MGTSQSLTPPDLVTDKTQIPISHTPVAVHGQTYIDFCAVQGLVTDEDGKMRTMTATEFAGMIGVARETLYDWQKRIPDFWDKVRARRKEIGGNNRIMKVYNGLYLKAAAGNPQAAALWLANHDPDFRMPTQKVEHEAGQGLADLIQQVRKVKQTESKVIDVTPAEKTDNA